MGRTGAAPFRSRWSSIRTARWSKRSCNYVKSLQGEDGLVTVLIPDIIPQKRRHEILHNQRGRLLETVLKPRTDVVIATLPFQLDD